jgi:uncharacterized protein (TIGR00255 family)
MLRSMTGFGTAAGVIDGVEYVVEVRSVNNRYLKCIAKLPEAWSQTESDVETLCRQHARRGTVTLTVRMRLRDENAAYEVNTAALSRYLDQLRPVTIDAGGEVRVDLASLLALPGVCEPPGTDELRRRTRDGLMALIAQALEALVDMRTREGEALVSELRGHCDVVESGLAEVMTLAPQVVCDYQQRLTRRVQELTAAAKVEIDADQLAREVAIFAERCDVAEEIARLGGHIEQFRETMEAAEPAGRKLDFIAQEMLREANTIASKAASGEIARRVVDIKTAIDRIKEQVQNVE